MTDLTEAVELAARALYAQQWPGKDFDALTPLEQLNWRPPDVWSRNYWKRAHTMTPKVVG